MGMFHYYDLGYCETFVFDEFLVNQIKQGETITNDHAEVLETVIKKHFKNKPMVYISNRIMSYAVDPLVYVNVNKIQNLVAIAIVTEEDNFKMNAEYERNFYSKPFEIFRTLGQAIDWVHKTVEDI